MRALATAKELTVMALGIVDGVIFQISRILESVFDGIEYRLAKNASNRMAKQKMKARRHLRDSKLGLYEFENGPQQRQRVRQEY
jgi:hypothetical protein